MLRIFIGLQAIKFYCFPPPGPPPPVTTFELFSPHHHISIVFLSSTTTTTTTFQLFSPHHHHISTVRKQKVVALKRPPPFTLNVPVNIARTLVCTGHWSWNVLNAFGTITTRVVLYAITRSEGRNLHERGLSWVSRLWSSYTQKREDVGKQFLFPFFRGERRRGSINFHSLQIALYLTLFVIVFNKVFKTVSLLWFYC